MTNMNNEQPKDKQQSRRIVLPMGAGIALGVTLGAAIGNIGIGIAVSIALGGIGVAINRRRMGNRH
jgi:hypothetical protein